MTARGDPVDRVMGLQIGADDYLPKPFNERESNAEGGGLEVHLAVPLNGLAAGPNSSFSSGGVKGAA